MNHARQEVEKSFDRILTDVVDSVEAAANPSYWVYKYMKEDLYDNQIEIVNDVCNLEVTDSAILESRGSGKTYSVAIALARLCVMYRGFKIGVFGPKKEQAERILKEISKTIVKPGTKLHDRIDWDQTIASRVVFKNGSEIVALSADETTQQEGWHFHVVVCDEAHRISDISVNQRIEPMLGSYSIAKMIKLGISMYRNHFWKSCVLSRNYKVLKRTWLESPILLSSGSFQYKHPEATEPREYPTRIVKRLPLSIKRELFPDRPDLHYEGDMTELDYKTQYNMEWVSDVNLLLSEEDQIMLVDGLHEILTHGRPEMQEVYFFGLDTAPGTLMPGKKDLDYTHLAIWRKRADNIVEKCANYEWQGDVIAQIDEIKQIIHPLTGLFRCTFGLADYSNIAINAVEAFRKEKIPIEGIVFGHTEVISRKNYKNAMYDEFVFELKKGNVKYPSLKEMDKKTLDHSLMKQQILLKKSFNEWCTIEKHLKMGINSKIEAPDGGHDDCPSADILANWAARHMDQFTNAMGQAYRIPTLQINAVPTLQNMGMGNKQQTNRYLQ